MWRTILWNRQRREEKNAICVWKENINFFFVTSNQFIIICLASDFHSLCHWFSRDFRKPSQLDEFGSNTFIANTFYMNRHWLASGYAACAMLYVVFFSFFLYYFQYLRMIRSTKSNHSNSNHWTYGATEKTYNTNRSSKYWFSILFIVNLIGLICFHESIDHKRPPIFFWQRSK